MICILDAYAIEIRFHWGYSGVAELYELLKPLLPEGVATWQTTWESPLSKCDRRECHSESGSNIQMARDSRPYSIRDPSCIELLSASSTCIAITRCELGLHRSWFPEMGFAPRKRWIAMWGRLLRMSINTQVQNNFPHRKIEHIVGTCRQRCDLLTDWSSSLVT